MGEAQKRVWRVGQHYGLHVYEGDRPVATFHQTTDATVAVDAVNKVSALVDGAPDTRDAWAIVSPESGQIIVSSVRSTREAALLCWWRDLNLSAAAFDAAGFRCVPVTISAAPPPVGGGEGPGAGEGEGQDDGK